jgi:hypothetical protein
MMVGSMCDAYDSAAKACNKINLSLMPVEKTYVFDLGTWNAGVTGSIFKSM